MFVVWAVLAILLGLAGLVGCVLPVLPGPPLSYVGFLVIWAARGFDAHTFGGWTPWILLAATAVVTALDFLAPVIGARRYGATKAGIWGSVIGMIAGAIWFPPFGLILGTLLGALVGELLAGQRGRRALKASWGVFVGTALGLLLKIAVSLAILWFVVAETFG